MPLRIEDVPSEQVPAALGPLLYRDLFGLDELQARRVLLEAVTGPDRPDVRPTFPGRGSAGALSRLGGSGSLLPGSAPPVWNVRPRDSGFTARPRQPTGATVSANILRSSARSRRAPSSARHSGMVQVARWPNRARYRPTRPIW